VILKRPDLQKEAPHGLFAQYVVPHEDKVPVDYDGLETGLNVALYFWNAGLGIDRDLSGWFKKRTVPKTTLPPDLILRLAQGPDEGPTRQYSSNMR